MNEGLLEEEKSMSVFKNKSEFMRQTRCMGQGIYTRLKEQCVQWYRMANIKVEGITEKRVSECKVEKVINGGELRKKGNY